MKNFKFILISITVILIAFLTWFGIKEVSAQEFFGKTADICQFWKAIFDFAIRIAGVLTVAAILIGSVYYLVSLGSAEKIKRAKDIISGAVFGMLLALLSWGLFNVLNPYLLECKIEVPLLGPDPCAAVSDDKIYKTKEECETTEEKCSSENPCNRGKKGWCCSPCRGEGIVEIAESYKGTCLGANHCAWFVSTVLQKSGCPWGSLGVGGLADKLSSWGWQRHEGNEGIQAGDIAFKSGHVEIAASSTKTIGSNLGMSGGCEGTCPSGQGSQSKVLTEWYATGTDLCAYCSNIPGEAPRTGRFCGKNKHPKCYQAGNGEGNQCVKDGRVSSVKYYYRRPGA
jgi:hypothetical protein